MNPILVHAVFAEKRGAEQAVKRSSSESWNATEKLHEIVPDASKKQLQRAIRGQVALDSSIHSDGWRGYNGLVDMGYKKHFRVHHGEDVFARGNCHINGISMALNHSGHMPNEGLQSSIVFPDKRFIYTARNVSLDFITDEDKSL